MSMYLSNSGLQPTGSEVVEFLDDPPPPPPPAVRTYAGAGITVYWDAGRCWHSERCTSGLPAVFDKAARPWVALDGADAAAVARVVDTCPSGALSYTRTDGAPHGRRGRRADEDPAAATAPMADEPDDAVADGTLVTIRPQADGPLSIEGPVALVRPDGSTEVADRLTLCRCGHSGAKPRCDGSHERVGFRAPGVA